MDSQKIVEKLKGPVSRAGSPEFEVFVSREIHGSVEVKDQEIHSFESAETLGASLRLIQDHKMGFAYTTDLSDSGLNKLFETALATSRYSDSSEFLSLPQDGPAPRLDFQDCDSSFLSLPQAKKIDMALRLEKAALSFHPKIKRVRGASYEGNLSEVSLTNSWGLHRHHQNTMNVLSLMAVAEEGEEAEMAFEFEFSPFFADLNPEAVGLRAAKKAFGYLGSQLGPTFKGPVVLEPLVAAEILDVLAPSFYADHRVKKCSLFDAGPGETILSPHLNLIDDGTLKGGFASFPFDGEGVPRRRLLLVKEGILQQVLADTHYGARLKAHSTGSSSREGIKRPPEIGHSNFYILPGTLPLQEILKKIHRGIFMTELIGIHTANPISGDFSVGAQGFLIEKGEITTPLKQMALSGNLKTMLNCVAAVASDLRFYFKVGSPSLLISEMDVAGQ